MIRMTCSRTAFAKQSRLRMMLLTGFLLCAMQVIGQQLPVLFPASVPSMFFMRLVSRSSGGVVGNDASGAPSLSADGRFVVFQSKATNLVPNDTNGYTDIFLYDRLKNTVERINCASDGSQGDGDSYVPCISGNGRYIVYGSYADNLVADDANQCADIFYYDRYTRTTTLVDILPDGTQSERGAMYHSISDDGRFVCFGSSSRNLTGISQEQANIYVRDMTTGQISCVTVGYNGGEADQETVFMPEMSGDGRYVAFGSHASNLVPNDTNGCADVFVHDRVAGTTVRVSVASDGTQGDQQSGGPTTTPNPLSMSSDGRYIVFTSSATNLVANDTNAVDDIFRHDMQTGQTIRVSISSYGVQGNAASQNPVLSADGLLIVFNSLASNLVMGDYNGTGDVFVRSILGNSTKRINIATNGSEANRDSSGYISMDSDGNNVAFASLASSLVSGDNNNTADVFLYSAGIQSFYQPDLLVRNAADGTSIGDDIYNVIAAQTKDQSVASGMSAVYYATLQNDGTANDSFILTDDIPDSAGLTVRYSYITDVGETDITADVQGIGWTSPSLATQASLIIRIELTLTDAIVAFDESRQTTLIATSTQDATKSDAITAVITKDLLGELHLSATPSSPAVVNSTLQLTANLDDAAVVEYAFYAKPSGAAEFTLLQDYTPNNVCLWTPTASGTYALRVRVRVVGSLKEYNAEQAIDYIVTNRLTAVALNADPASPAAVNTPVALTATPTGGARVLYQFRLKKSTDTTYSVVQDYSLDNTCEWTPAQVGTYYLVVWAKEQGATAAYQAYAAKSFVVVVPLTGVTLATNPVSPVLANTTVALTATPTGGSQVQYQFRIKKSTDAGYTVLQGYSSAATCQWTPAQPGTYYLALWAREQGSTASYQVYATRSFVVAAPLSAVALAAAPAGPKPPGTAVTLTATPTGGARVEYQFRVKKSTAAAYTVIQNYSTANTCPWTPSESGLYYLIVWAREVGSAAAYQVSGFQSYTVAVPLTGVTLNLDPPSPVAATTPVLLTATPTPGASANCQFRVKKSTAATYTVLQSYSADNDCTWTPTEAGTYYLVVWAREPGNTSAYQVYAAKTVVVTPP